MTTTSIFNIVARLLWRVNRPSKHAVKECCEEMSEEIAAHDRVLADEPPAFDLQCYCDGVEHQQNDCHSKYVIHLGHVHIINKCNDYA